jgi:hypothetical protein
MKFKSEKGVSLRKQIKIKQSFKRKCFKSTGKQISVHININDEKGFFKCSELRTEEIDYLLTKGYSIVYRQNIFGKRDYYLIKPRGNESIEHFLLVNDIANYLKRFFNVWLYHSVKPDIVFEFKNKKIAIEVETGKSLRTNKKALIQKVEMLNENFEGDWFFVVTNRNLSGKYRKFGKTYTRQNVIKRLRYYISNKPKEIIREKSKKKEPTWKTPTYYYKL